MNFYNTGIGKVYFFTDGEFIKIGYTIETLGRRLQRLSTGSPKKLYALGYVQGTMDDETALHILFKEDRIRPDGEWFRPSDNLLDYINEVNSENEEFKNKCAIVDDEGIVRLCDCIRGV